ncbi:MAG TPA: hypothetical protein PK247_11195, partial [Candidatus Goldiibacteriota bacterium]|nr:hypothetical protein [Candidatus Goldiibacteriota bacterium]
MGKKNILFISNGYGDSPVISGGEVRLYNLIKHFSLKFEQSFLTTRGGLISVKNNKIDSRFKTIYTSKNRLLGLKEITGFQRLIGYFISAFDSVKIMKSGSRDAVYTSTDYFCDIYPSYKYKRTNPS